MTDTYKISLILSAVRNLLVQNNPNGVNDYLIAQINREIGLL
jgi:hypothetical protein